ncbi:MAG: RES family NAD+ phosphorylase [Terriglobia bacterium]
MKRVYRILRRPYSKSPLDGEGGYRFGGRWSSVGTRLAYTAEHLSLAMIGYFVHIDREDQPRDLVVFMAEIPETVSRTSVSAKQLPENWRQSPAPPELTEVGDGFVRDQRAAILIVPSALAPSESNWLINPQHPDYRKIRAHPATSFEYDRRFFK